MRRRAFTLAEMVVVVVVLGLLAAITSHGLINLVPAARQEAALSRARLLNVARQSYGLLVPGASDRWAAAESGVARLNLLLEAGLIETAGEAFLSLPGSYQLELSGALRNRTQVLKEGRELVYLP